MKQVFGAALLLALSTAAQAQISSGTIMLGGSLGYSQRSTEGNQGFSGPNEKLSESWQFNVSPTAAYFVAENLALGLNLDYSAGSSTVYRFIQSIPVSGIGSGTVVPFGESKQNSRNLRVGPQARYYKFIGEKAAFFGQLGAGYQSSRVEGTHGTLTMYPEPNSLTTGTGFYAQLTPGFAFFPSNKFGLELTLRGLGYQRLTEEDARPANPSYPTLAPRKTTTSGFDAAFGLASLQLGAAFYFGRE